MNAWSRLFDGASDVRKTVLAGSYLGLCWGLFTWAAISAYQAPPPIVAVVETILSIIAWAAIAAGVHWFHVRILCRFLFRKQASPEVRRNTEILMLTMIFLAAYANYYLHPYLIAGLYLASLAGVSTFLGICLLIFLPALLLSRMGSRALPGIGRSLYLAPLLVGVIFVYGRVYLSSMPPGSGRLPIALTLYFLASLVFVWIAGRRPKVSRPPVGLLVTPVILIAAALIGTRAHDFETRARDEGVGGTEASWQAGAAPVILISLDTVRPDHLSLYGYALPTSPNLDAFAENAIVFDRAYANSSWTLSSHASLFTGLYPSEHGAHYPIGASAGVTPGPLDPGVPTIASVFADEGYRTAAIASNRLSVSPEFGIDRGFQQVFADRRMTDRPMPFTAIKAIARIVRLPLLLRIGRGHHDAKTMTDRAIYWLDHHRPVDRPFLLFLNYLDPHAPYSPPISISRRLGMTPPGDGFTEIRALYYRKRNRLIDLEPWERAILSDHYDGEIAHMDDHLGRLFEYLDAEGVLDRAWIILFSDHGEFLGEHQRVGHGKAIYEEVTRALLVVRPPGGLPKGERVARLISLLEVPSMVLEGTGVPVPPTMRQEAFAGNRPVIAEKFLTTRDRHYGDRDDVGLLQTILWDRWKWIVAHPGNSVELFDLDADPEELNNLAENETELQEAGFQQYQDWLEKIVPAGAHGGDESETAEAKKDQLRALGYLQ